MVFSWLPRWCIAIVPLFGENRKSRQLCSPQAILMDTNCSMRTRSYSTQGTHYQGDDMETEYDDDE